MNDTSNQRRAERKKICDMILVEDAISGLSLGRIGNLSSGGMMLICSQRLHDDALYQLRFALPIDENGNEAVLEVGVHEQWTEQAAIPGQFWSGLRIIDISGEAEKQLLTWLEQA